MHPLEPAGGGDEFHNGGRQVYIPKRPAISDDCRLGARGNGRFCKVVHTQETSSMAQRRERLNVMTILSHGLRHSLTVLAIVVLTPPLAAGQGNVRIVQTNSAGDSIHIIDPATNKVVGEITGVERAHGVSAAPDGSWLYVSNEADTTVDVVNGKTLKVTKKIPLSGHPNNIAITPDGRKVYVAIAQEPGAVDVIDAVAQEKVKSISVHGRVHNTFMTPDGKHVVAGMIGARNMTVIDTETDMPVWTLYFDLGVRPMAFDTNPDGSTKRVFVQLSNFNGFAVVDFQTRKEVDRIALPELPPGKEPVLLGGNASHGLQVTADGKTLVVDSLRNSTLYVFALPDLKLVGGVEVAQAPDWVTTTPDGRFAYVANAGANSVSVVDIKALKEVAQITVGQVPKRNITAVLP